MTLLSVIERECFDVEIVSNLHDGIQTMPRYGSVLQRSYNRFAAEKAGRLLS